MITLYSGTPGSGKSLHVAERIYAYLTARSPHNVIANFEVNGDVFWSKSGRRCRMRGNLHCVDNSDLTPDFLYRYAMAAHRRHRDGHIFEGQTLLVIDEAQMLFNSRDWKIANRMDWCSFFTQHRKYGYNIILIAQFDRMLDRQIRSLIEYHVIHRKLSNFGLFGAFLGLLCGGSLFVAITLWYGLKEKLYHEYFISRKRYRTMYDSYKIFAVGEKSGEGSGDNT